MLYNSVMKYHIFGMVVEQEIGNYSRPTYAPTRKMHNGGSMNRPESISHPMLHYYPSIALISCFDTVDTVEGVTDLLFRHY